MRQTGLTSRRLRGVPGRLRAEVVGLRGHPGFARRLEHELAGHPGTRSVTANPLTGMVLVLYDPGVLSVEELLNLIARQEERQEPSPTPARRVAGSTTPRRRRGILLAKALQPVFAGLLLLVLTAKVALRGRSERGRSEHLDALSVFTSAFNGYVQLRSLTRGVPGRRVLVPLITEYASIGLKGYREALLGLAADAGSYLLQFLELSGLRRAQRRAQEFLRPRGHAHLRLPGEREIDIPISELQPGEVIRIGAGEHVPADAVIEEGAGLVDESILTNRAFLSRKGPGDPVFLGTRVEQGTLMVRVAATGPETRLGKFFQRTPIPRDRTLPATVTTAVRRTGAAGLALAVATLLVTRTWRRALAVVAALNPNAITMSCLAASGAAVEAAARANVRVQRRNALTTLARVDVVLFGKTGTLTAESPAVDAVVPAHETERVVLTLAASTMRQSTHPLAVPVLERALESGIDLLPAHEVETIPGQGVRATVDGTRIVVGAEWFMQEEGVPIEVAQRAFTRMEAKGDDVLFVGRNGQLAGLVVLRERLMPGARETVVGLRGAGIAELGVLSADPTASAARLADELGIRRTWSGVDDEGKRDIVRRLQRDGHVVAVVGASASDMLAMAEADVAIGFAGASWTPSPHAADVILLQGQLAILPGLIGLGRKLRATHRQNLIIASVVSSLGAAGAVIGLVPFGAADEINHFLMLGLLANARRLSLVRLAQPLNPSAATNGPAWHALPPNEVVRLLASDHTEGLAEPEAGRRRARFGANALAETTPPTFMTLFGRQLSTGMTVLLGAAAGGAALVSEPLNGALIGGVLILNAGLGAAQEYRAERAAAALRGYIAPTARSVRGGEERLLPAADLVPGDVVRLQAGDTVPADARIIESHGFEVEEAMLTGESMPVQKTAASVRLDSELADRTSMTYLGSSVAGGRATAIVVATGMRTAVGQIAGMLGGEPVADSALQRRLVGVSRRLAALSIVSGVLFVGVGLLRRIPLPGLVMGGVSLVTAAIPEGLPAVVTIALSAAQRRMAGHNIIVRRLSAIEALGRVTVICCDKTGTLTQNRMAVQAVVTGGLDWSERTVPGPHAGGDAEWLLTIGAVCNDAVLVNGEARATLGGSTEGALVMAASDAGLDVNALRARYERVMELPFSTDRGFMAVASRTPEHGWLAFIKGAPETIVDLCGFRRTDGAVTPFDAGAREEALAISDRMAYEAMRVLGVAYVSLSTLPSEAWLEQPQDCVFAGLVGMSDPLRPEVRDAVARCERAGVRVVMVTGDHRSTAVAIARQLGLAFERAEVVEGRAIDAITDEQLDALLPHTQVFARVTPAHKLRIVQAMQTRGEVVAMTGDGVNDAPAVKRADVGIAMGHTGTEVTRQASSIVLEDDSFVSIVRAIEEGRGVHYNLRRSLGYLVGGNIGETLFMLAATLVGGTVPLLPVHLLLVNLFTDALPVMALAALPASSRALQRREPSDLFDQRFYSDALRRGVVTAAASTVVYVMDGQSRSGGPRTMTLAGLVASQLVQAHTWRSHERGDRFFYASLGTSWGALVGITVLRPLQRLFGVGPLGLREWGWVLTTAVAADWLIPRDSGTSVRLLPKPARRAPGTNQEGGR